MKKPRKVLFSLLLVMVSLLAIQCPPHQPPDAPEAPGLLAGDAQIGVSWAR